MSEMNECVKTSVLITIIVPVYNVCKYLPQCLDSVKYQSYYKIEILLIDDGSTDGSGQVCDKYASDDERITVFHTENRGLSAARNLGLDYAKGEYIAFLDGDDWLEPNAIDVFVNYAIRYDSDIVVCRCYKEYADIVRESSLPVNFNIYNRDKALYELICCKNIGQGVWNKLYRKKLFSGLRFPIDRLHEDLYLTYQIIEVSHKTVYLPNMLYHWRMRQSSISHSASLKSYIDRWLAYHEMYKALAAKGEEYRFKLTENCIFVSGQLWFRYPMLVKSKNKIEKKQYKEIINSMQRFAYSHIFEILFGKYSKKTKIYCCICGIHNCIYLKMLNFLWNQFSRIRKDKSLCAPMLYE